MKEASSTPASRVSTLFSGTNGFEHLRRILNKLAYLRRRHDNMSQLVGPAIAAAYDFGALGSLMDVGGGNSIILLSHILRAHPTLRGVPADWDSACTPVALPIRE